MPTIAFSENLMQSSASSTNIMGRTISLGVQRGGQNAGLWPNPDYGSNTAFPQFHIMKGSVPSNLSSITSFSTRSADVLLSWAATMPFNQSPGNFTPSTATYYLNPAVFTSSYKAASASGTATWFWWTVRAAPFNELQNTLFQQIAGTVGVTGSGADLEISSTTITENALYRLFNFRLQFPTTFNY